MSTRIALSMAALSLSLAAAAGCSSGGSTDPGGSDAAPGSSDGPASGRDAEPGVSKDASGRDAEPGASRDAGGRDAEPDASRDAGGASQGDRPLSADTGLAWPSGKYISVAEVHTRSQIADPDMLLVNVVDEMYYDLGHIAGSLKIPWDALAGRLAEVDPDRHVVLYCRKGVRSESAYSTLVERGYPLVFVMEGGIERWVEAGYPTVAE